MFLYRIAWLRNRRMNQDYLRRHPGITLPADYSLYETHQLNYRKFMEDGALAAMEIRDWTQPYLPANAHRVLDWGCGPGRVIRHLPALMPGSIVYGCDVNEEIIKWNSAHYPLIDFITIAHTPSMPYDPSFFDLVYGLSVLTHIEANGQVAWLAELYRILKKNGVLLITTQGARYHNSLLPKEKKRLQEHGICTQPYAQKGHRMLATYHTAQKFRELIQPYFTILEYYDGKTHPGKIGGQDVWILRKI